MNVAANIAVCQRCDEAFVISDLLGTRADVIRDAGIPIGVPDSFDINQPPSGVSYDNHGMGWRISSTTRSAAAFFLVPFMIVWSGGSLGGIYGSQLYEGEFDVERSLIGIPFFLGTLLFGSFALLTVIGRTVIKKDEMDHDAGSIFLGIGPVGWTSRFRWSEVRGIDETYASGRRGNQSKQITLRIDKGDIQFGSMLSEKRRRYVLHALKQLVGTGGY